MNKQPWIGMLSIWTVILTITIFLSLYILASGLDTLAERINNIEEIQIATVEILKEHTNRLVHRGE